ncbi:hypothetical protein CPB97_002487, partial [Podila verticillata]
MRVRDSVHSMYLSLVLWQVAFLLYLAPTLGECSPRMDITHPLADIPMADFHNTQQPQFPPVKPIAVASSNFHAGGVHAGAAKGSFKQAAAIPVGGGRPAPASASSSPSARKHHKRVFAGFDSQESQGSAIIAPTKPEYVPTRYALLATIDGELHCVETITGKFQWTRQPKAEGAVVSSNATKFSRSAAAAKAGLTEEQEFDAEDWTFIVEPSEIPMLYVYSNSSGLQ